MAFNLSKSIHSLLRKIFRRKTFPLNCKIKERKFEICYSQNQFKSQMSEEISKKTKTLIVVVLDESGSMQVQKKDVIGGYNSFIEIQRNVENDQGRLILIKFSTVTTIVHCATPLADAPLLNESNFRPGGSTSLLDAVSDGIRIAEGSAQKDERVLVLIMTDGEENSSTKATTEEVKTNIAAKENLGNWTFAYIGENPDGWAKALGQNDRAAPNVKLYDTIKQGSNFELASKATSAYRSDSSAQKVEGFYANFEGASDQPKTSGNLYHLS